MKNPIVSMVAGFVAVLCCPVFSQAQNPNVVKTEYTRNSITLLVLDYGDSPYMDHFRTPGRLNVPEKFDDNNLNYTLLPANFTRSQMIDHSKSVVAGITYIAKSNMNDDFIEPLFGLVKSYKIPNAIIAKEFNRQPDGSFNMDVIAQRGLYNADVTDYQKAQATMRKDNALKDQGEQLLNNSYILVFDFKQVKTMTEVYNAMDAVSEKPVVRTQNGYKANGNAYLYRIDFNDSVYNTFLQSMWIDNNTDPVVRQARIKLFDNNIFPVQRIAIIPFETNALQYNADQGVLAPKVQKNSEQLFADLISNTLNGTVTSIEKLNDQFRVKAQITSVHPIGVKIGTKEGLKLDQRYFVFESRLGPRGNQYSKRMGVIRSKKVVNNSYNISDKKGMTEPSLFYQTAGKKLGNMGMFVEQKNDWGFGLCFGYTYGNMGGANLSLEFNIMSIFNSAFKLKTGITALKLYVAGGFDYRTYDSKSLVYAISGQQEQSIMFVKFEGGFAKDFYFARNFQIGPVLGFGMEQANLTEDYSDVNGGTKYTLSTLYGNAGLRFGINITHNLQLQITGNYLMPVGTVTEDIKKDKTSISGWPKDRAEEWDEIFLDRKGVGFGGGLRLQF